MSALLNTAAAMAMLMTMASLGACTPEPNSDPSAMSIGEEFTISLEANATTGYDWVVVSPEDESVITLVAEEYDVSGLSFGDGAGGEQSFTFQATGIGETQVVLHYMQPWDPSTRADEYVQDISVVR